MFCFTTFFSTSFLAHSLVFFDYPRFFLPQGLVDLNSPWCSLSQSLHTISLVLLVTEQSCIGRKDLGFTSLPHILVPIIWVSHVPSLSLQLLIQNNHCLKDPGQLKISISLLNLTLVSVHVTTIQPPPSNQEPGWIGPTPFTFSSPHTQVVAKSWPTN